jgi:hypothetical protein
MKVKRSWATFSLARSVAVALDPPNVNGLSLALFSGAPAREDRSNQIQFFT